MAQTLPTSFLLDTNILVHLIRGKPIGKTIEASFGLSGVMNRCIIPVVTVGEMYSLARKWSWGANKITLLQNLLGQLVLTDINNPAILDAYGELDDVSNRAGRAMGKNDVWIAATAKVSRMTLLSTDGDFDHLHPVHLTRLCVDEKTGKALA